VRDLRSNRRLLQREQIASAMTVMLYRSFFDSKLPAPGDCRFLLAESLAQPDSKSKGMMLRTRKVRSGAMAKTFVM